MHSKDSDAGHILTSCLSLSKVNVRASSERMASARRLLLLCHLQSVNDSHQEVVLSHHVNALSRLNSNTGFAL